MDKFTESMRRAEAAGYHPIAELAVDLTSGESALMKEALRRYRAGESPTWLKEDDMVVLAATAEEKNRICALLADMRTGQQPVSATSPSESFGDLAANAAVALRSLLNQLDAANSRVNALEAALLVRSGPDPVLPIDLTVQELEQVRAFVRGMRALREAVRP